MEGRAGDHLESSDALKSQLKIVLLMDGTSECKLTLTETHLIGENAPRLAAAPGWRAFPAGSPRCKQPGRFCFLSWAEPCSSLHSKCLFLLHWLKVLTEEVGGEWWQCELWLSLLPVESALCTAVQGCFEKWLGPSGVTAATTSHSLIAALCAESKPGSLFSWRNHLTWTPFALYPGLYPEELLATEDPVPSASLSLQLPSAGVRRKPLMKSITGLLGGLWLALRCLNF